MFPSYEQILEIAAEILEKVKRAGHRLDRCVWELHPLIYMVMVDANQDSRPREEVRATLLGVPVRLDYKVSGIMLKMVNLNPHE